MKQRIRRWGEAHPRLWATRHVVKAALEIAVGLLLARIALGLVLDLPWGWLPDWRPPRILPHLPDLPWPDIDLPDWSLPGWVTAVLRTKKYWFPLLVGIAVAVAEVRRRRNQTDRREDAAWPGPSTPRSTPPGDSSSSTPASPASPSTATPARPPR